MEVKKKRKVRIQETEDTRLRPFDKLRATAWQGKQNEKHWNSGRLEGWGKEILRRQATVALPVGRRRRVASAEFRLASPQMPRAGARGASLKPRVTTLRVDAFVVQQLRHPPFGSPPGIRRAVRLRSSVSQIKEKSVGNQAKSFVGLARQFRTEEVKGDWIPVSTGMTSETELRI